MPILKFPAGSYVNADAVEKELRYVFGKSLAKGGMSVDPEHAAPQMQMVKTVWGQTDGKMLHHFILSFSDFESQRIRSMGELLSLGYHICCLYAGEFQIVFGIHHSSTWHIHFVMNSVSFSTGRKFVHNKADDAFLTDYIRTCSLPFAFGDRIRSNFLPVYYT